MHLLHFLYIPTLALVFCVLGCSSDPNSQANELYVGAVRALERMVDKPESYSTAYDDFSEAKSAIAEIINEYPSSGIAVDILSGKKDISFLPYELIDDFENELRPKAMAEKSALALLELIAEENDHEIFYNPEMRSRSLKIASVKFSLGMRDSAKTYLDRAIASFRPDNRGSGELAVEAATLLSEAGEFEEALMLVGRLPKIKDMRTGQATHLGPYHNAAFIAVANEYSKNGKFEEAFALINKISSRWERIHAKIDMAYQVAEAGEERLAVKFLQEVLESAERVEEESNKARVLADIAGCLAIVGKKDQALGLLAKAENFGGADHIVARNYIIADEMDHAISVVEKKFDREESTLDWKYVLPAVTKYASRREAKEFLQFVLDDFKHSGRSLAIVAKAYIDIEENRKALGLLERAVSMSSNVDRYYSREFAYLEIAAVYVAMGHFDSALKLVNLSDGKPLMKSDKLESLAQIANGYLGSGEFGDARRVTLMGFELADDLDEFNEQFAQYVALAEIFEKASTKREPEHNKVFSKIVKGIFPLESFSPEIRRY